MTALGRRFRGDDDSYSELPWEWQSSQPIHRGTPMPRAIFLPAFALVVLTIIVWVRMYTMRVAQMKRQRIHPQAVDTPAQSATKLPASRAAHNFRNPFDLPAAFYLALTVAAE